MRIVLVSLYDGFNFAIRVLKTVLSDYDVRLIFFKQDYIEEKSTDKEVKDLAYQINSQHPDIVGFTLRSAFYPEFKRIAPLINSRIIVGGQHPTICPEDFKDYADTICIGEGEDVIRDIIEGKKGIVYGGFVKDVNTIPSPVTSNMKKMSVITARGCFFNCVTTRCRKKSSRVGMSEGVTPTM
ncbi:MAG: cobalamin-dependent protein [Candidatus Hodarchaeota archaeon]